MGMPKRGVGMHRTAAHLRHTCSRLGGDSIPPHQPRVAPAACFKNLLHRRPDLRVAVHPLPAPAPHPTPPHPTLSPPSAVFDGHGGNATAEWLAANLLNYVEKYWEGNSAPEKAITEAFIQADKVGAAPGAGWVLGGCRLMKDLQAAQGGSCALAAGCSAPWQTRAVPAQNSRYRGWRGSCCKRPAPGEM